MGDNNEVKILNEVRGGRGARKESLVARSLLSQGVTLVEESLSLQ